MNFRVNQDNGMFDLACFSDIEDKTNDSDDIIIQNNFTSLVIFYYFFTGVVLRENFTM